MQNTLRRMENGSLQIHLRQQKTSLAPCVLMERKLFDFLPKAFRYEGLTAFPEAVFA